MGQVSKKEFYLEIPEIPQFTIFDIVYTDVRGTDIVFVRYTLQCISVAWKNEFSVQKKRN